VSRRDWKDRIRDILEAIAEIQKFTHELDFETFRKDDKCIRAVEMNFVIIGEAANAIPQEVEDRYSDIPWNLMRAMRNRLVHLYFKVDEKLMWDTVQNDLSRLLPVLEKLL